MKSKRLIALALALLGGIVLILIFDKPPALPAVMILPPGPLVVKSGRAPDRWIPTKWGWLHRVCRAFLGAPKQVRYNVRFMETSETAARMAAGNSLGQPQAESNGLAVWITPQRTNPLDYATLVSAPRVAVADQMEANVTTTDGAASHRADLFARLEKETIDLSTRLIITDSGGKTNFIAALRAQLPYGQALFLLDVRQPGSATNRTECVITVDEYDSKGNKVR